MDSLDELTDHFAPYARTCTDDFEMATRIRNSSTLNGRFNPDEYETRTDLYEAMVTHLETRGVIDAERRAGVIAILRHYKFHAMKRGLVPEEESEGVENDPKILRLFP